MAKKKTDIGHVFIILVGGLVLISLAQTLTSGENVIQQVEEPNGAQPDATCLFYDSSSQTVATSSVVSLANGHYGCKATVPPGITRVRVTCNGDSNVVESRQFTVPIGYSVCYGEVYSAAYCNQGQGITIDCPDDDVTSTTLISGGECDYSSDCPADHYVGNPFCQSGDVYQNWQNNRCVNHQCVGDQYDRRVENCQYDCKDAKCTAAPMTSTSTIEDSDTTTSTIFSPGEQEEEEEEEEDSDGPNIALIGLIGVSFLAVVTAIAYVKRRK